MIGRAQQELFRWLVVFVYRPAVGAAQLDRMGNDSRQHGFEIERRADRLTDFAEGFELAYRACQFVGSFIQFFKQPHILDGDNRLVSEGFEELDLRRGEGARLVATCAQHSNEFPLLTKRNGQVGAKPADDAQHWKIVLRAKVGNVERAMLTHPAKLWRINTDLDAARGYGYGTKMSPEYHSVSLAESQQHVINPTNPSGALDDRVEDRLHIRG